MWEHPMTAVITCEAPNVWQSLLISGYSYEMFMTEEFDFIICLSKTNKLKFIQMNEHSEPQNDILC